MAAESFLLNTPPTFSWYVATLVLKWIKSRGGLAAMGERKRAKTEALYRTIDATGLYRNPVANDCRSWMNVSFTLSSPNFDNKFLAEARTARLMNLEGHRSTGGMRATFITRCPWPACRP